MSPLSFQGNVLKDHNNEGKNQKKNQTYTFNNLKKTNEPLTVEQVNILYKMNSKT